MNVENKTVVVTGANAGLGLAISRLLIQKGATVYGIARRKDKLQAVAADLGKAFIPIPADVTSRTEVKNAIDVVLKSGRIDVLVNNAGLGRFGPVESMTEDDWTTQVDVNLAGVFNCTQAVIPTMKKQNKETGFGGHIVNIASVAGLLGNPNISVYNATKFGVRGMSDALMKELRGDGIKVSCVYPGSIHTEFFEVAQVQVAPNAMTAEDVASTVVHVIESADNYLISEVVMRPLRPRG